MVFKKGEKRSAGKASQDKTQKTQGTQGRKKMSKNKSETVLGNVQQLSEICPGKGS